MTINHFSLLLLLLLLFPVALKTCNLKEINLNNDENRFDGYLIAILLLIANFILIF